MDTAAGRIPFEESARLESQVTERQLLVLRLIAEGKTNAAIAEELGVTLAGAKWHVSELLSKLQLESREAAAEYYRWRNRPSQRLARRARALSGVSLLKAGGVFAGAAATVLAVVVAVGQTRDDTAVGPERPGLPFYMETRYWRDQTGTHTPQGRGAYWYQDSAHLRAELRPDNDSPPASAEAGPAGSVLVRDGVNQWRNGPLYRAEPLTKFAASAQAIPGMTLGPLGYDSIDAFIASKDPEGPAGGLYERKGKAKFLGRPVEIVARSIMDSNSQIVQERTLWIDAERLLVLKVVTTFGDAESGPITEGEEATFLRYGEHQPPDRFVFVPDPGSVELRCPAMPEGFGGGEWFPPFWRVPDVITPAGLRRASFGIQAHPDGTCGVALVDYGEDQDAAGGQPVLRVRQELAAPESVMPSAESRAPIEVSDGLEAVIGTTGDGSRAIAWITGELGFEISSGILSDAELLAFAREFARVNGFSTP